MLTYLSHWLGPSRLIAELRPTPSTAAAGAAGAGGFGWSRQVWDPAARLYPRLYFPKQVRAAVTIASLARQASHGLEGRGRYGSRGRQCSCGCYRGPSRGKPPRSLTCTPAYMRMRNMCTVACSNTGGAAHSNVTLGSCTQVQEYTNNFKFLCNTRSMSMCARIHRGRRGKLESATGQTCACACKVQGSQPPIFEAIACVASAGLCSQEAVWVKHSRPSRVCWKVGPVISWHSCPHTSWPSPSCALADI